MRAALATARGDRKVESGQASGGRVDKRGTTLSPILGPALDGNGFALIRDTDGGAYDGDGTYDRAVGPMQFIPSTWANWGADGNGDGRRDPHNIYDAALAAGRYLCAGTRDLTRRADLDRAILSYNRSDTYLRTVLSWLEFYRGGSHPVADGEASSRPAPDRVARPAEGPGRRPRLPAEARQGRRRRRRRPAAHQAAQPDPHAPPHGPGLAQPQPRPDGPGPRPTDPGPSPSPDPTDPGPSPSPSPSPDPTGPTTPPDPGETGPGCPGETPSPSPADPDPTASATGAKEEPDDPCAPGGETAA